VAAAGAGRLSSPVGRKFGGGRPRVSRTVGRCHQEKQCSLTLRSRGGPTAGHQAWATGQCAIFCGPGLASHRRPPLSSNVRPHVQILPCASISIQMQRLASRRPIQSKSLLVGALQGSSQSRCISCHQRSAHVLRRSRVALAVCPYLSSPRHGRAMARLRFARLQARCGISQVAWAVGPRRFGCRIPSCRSRAWQVWCVVRQGQGGSWVRSCASMVFAGCAFLVQLGDANKKCSAT
jgi:hypothetical protein